MSEDVTQFDVRKFCCRVRALAASDPGKALWAISQLVLQVISRQSSVARVFSSQQLDLVTLNIGASLLADLRLSARSENHVVYLLTQVGQYGGHGRVLRDLINANSSARQTVILSHVAPASVSEFDVISAAGVDVVVAPEVSLDRKVHWIGQRLAAIGPTRTYMMVHPFDVVTVAAAQPGFCGQLVFLHNCDHSLSLGVHIPHALHGDFHRKGFSKCRSERRGRPGYIVPLTADDKGSRCKEPFLARGHITTCTTGGFEKFTNRLFVEPRQYLYQYEDMVRAIVGATNGTHIHVGPLPDELVSRIRNSIAHLGIPEERFWHVPSVESVWEFFLRETIDIYVGSAPSGGGRATVEAMGAGLPLIVHSNYRSAFLCVEDEVYSDAMVWRDFDQLQSYLSIVDQQQLLNHSVLSRSYYEDYHTPQKLAEALARMERGLPQPEPEQCNWLGDDLQDFIDGCIKDLENMPTDEMATLLNLGKRD